MAALPSRTGRGTLCARVLVGSIGALVLAACGTHDEGIAANGEAAPAARQHVAPAPSAPTRTAVASFSERRPSANADATIAPSAPGDVPADPVAFNPAPYIGPIQQGINTDQSLPAHPVPGPTAPLPEGVKQIGH
jgi:hypothetical protein